VNKEKFNEITVSDNGIGIPKDDLEKLLKHDVRYSTEGTSKEKGSTPFSDSNIHPPSLVTI
jgi:signal transduction histidine kinase